MGNPYEMTIDLNVLNHLGINLYSNTPAVLSEVVANAWDADAEHVEITINIDEEKISITDDGHGMSNSDINKKFLNVGYRRREAGLAITSLHKRPVMGRKGIGKLSLFSIAKTIEVYSVTVKGEEKQGFKMVLDDIKEQIQNKGCSYKPEEITNFPDDLVKGTRIVITDFKRKFQQSEKFLKKRVARRFSVIGDEYNFNITINGNSVCINDRDYFHKIQFLWTYNDSTTSVEKLCKNLIESEDRSNIHTEDKIEISGWIGTVDNSGALKDSDTGDNLNKILVMVRGKVAQENILDVHREGGMYSKYVFGEIHANFLDTDKDEDIATSSRQEILEDDPRYIKLKDFIGVELKHIQKQWTVLRNKQGTQKALEYSVIKEWYGILGKDNKKKAQSLFGKINQLTIDNENERKSLLKHGILAFESMKVKENLDALDTLDGTEFKEFIRIFEDIDDIEATMYRQIVMGRIEVIKSLQEKVAEDMREKVLQKHLFKHLWLLDPGWERVETTEIMEKSIKTEFDKIDAKLSAEEKKGRVDLKYRTTSGKHLIIELKKATRPVSSEELIKQCRKYRNALIKILENSGRGNEPVEVLCVVGRPLKDWGSSRERTESDKALEGYHMRVILYQELIDSAQRSYQAYLDKHKEAGRIFELVKTLDELPISGSNLE